MSAPTYDLIGAIGAVGGWAVVLTDDPPISPMPTDDGALALMAAHGGA